MRQITAADTKRIIATTTDEVEQQAPESFTLSRVIQLLEAGRFAIPNFQRDFVWDAELIKELLRSVFLRYHTGILLLWDHDSSSTVSKDLGCQPLWASDTTIQDARLLVLDGQQRLTALQYALFAPKGKQIKRTGAAQGGTDNQDEKDKHAEAEFRFYVKIDPFAQYLLTALDTEDDENDMLDRLRSHYRESRTDLTSDAFTAEEYSSARTSDEVHFQEKRFPLTLLAVSSRERHEWFSAYEEYWTEIFDQYEAEGKDEEEEEVLEHLGKMKLLEDYLEVVLDYKLQHITLPSSFDRDRVRDIFLQVNRYGVKLSHFDLFSAKAALNGFNPRDMLAEAIETLGRELNLSSDEGIQKDVTYYFIGMIMLLDARPAFREDSEFSVARLFDRYLMPGTKVMVEGSERVLIESREDFQGKWNAAVTTLKEGLEQLAMGERYGAYDPSRYSNFVLCEGIVPVFCKLWTEARLNPDWQWKLQRWYWANVLMERYRTVAQAGAQAGIAVPLKDALQASADYIDMRSWFNDAEKKPTPVREFERRFGPGSFDSLDAVVVVNLMNTVVPIDLATGERRRDIVRSPRYIVGPDLAKSLGLPRRLVDSPFNKILVSDAGHKHMGSGEDRLARWRDRVRNGWQRRMGLSKREADQRFREMCESHLLDSDCRSILDRAKFSPTDMREFVDARERALLILVGKKVFEVDLSPVPADRALWERIVAIEERLIRSVAEEGWSAEGIPAYRVVAEELHDKSAIGVALENLRRRGETLEALMAEDIESLIRRNIPLGRVITVVSDIEMWYELRKRYGWRGEHREARRELRRLSTLRNAIAHNYTSTAMEPRDRRRGENAVEELYEMLRIEEG